MKASIHTYSSQFSNAFLYSQICGQSFTLLPWFLPCNLTFEPWCTFTRTIISGRNTCTYNSTQVWLSIKPQPSLHPHSNWPGPKKKEILSVSQFFHHPFTYPINMVIHCYIHLSINCQSLHLIFLSINMSICQTTLYHTCTCIYCTS